MKFFEDYINTINQLYHTGNATEHSYRPALAILIENILMVDGQRSSLLQIINEPRRIECGAPDLIITKSNIPVCYIETKDIEADLNSRANKQQFNRYINALDTVIITDYLVFKFYQKQEEVETIRIAELRNGTICPIDAVPELVSVLVGGNQLYSRFINFITAFANSEAQTITKSHKLAQIMAAKAKLMAGVIEKILDSSEDIQSENISFHIEKAEFQQHLIKNISNHDFADTYAQTITYGMFAARLQSSSNFPVRDDSSTRKLTLQFDRRIAAELIPSSNPFLSKLFQAIAVYNLDTRFRWIVDDLAEAFRVTDMNAVMGELGEVDPIIHFYEYFLSEYDPNIRRSRGVYYTPYEIVNFIVRAVDDILVSDFGLTKGLADNTEVTPTFQSVENNTQSPTGKSELQSLHKVQILDPATGTGTFLVETIKQIHSKFAGQQGIWQNYVSEHLLPRLNGFEILMAPYTMAHLNLNWTLEKTGFRNENEKRLNIFLTNSLEEFKEGARGQSRLYSQEADGAGKIKLDTPVMVVLGNPPYSAESQNISEWMDGLLSDYKKEATGEKLKERNSKALNDDYVKFIRFAQHFIEKNKVGVIAFITNHGFLDNPTFRGMRWNLMQSFDKIYIIDLHGNTLKKETAPDGSKDENVFDIKQGVSINIFVKNSSSNFPVRDNSSTKKLTLPTEIYHYNLYGKRKDKLAFLLKNKLSTVKFKKVKPKLPFYFFVPKSIDFKAEYEKGFQINELMKDNVTGIVTARDNLVIDIDKTTLINKIKKFCNPNLGDTEIREWLFPNKSRLKYARGDTKEWKLSEARHLIRNHNHEDFIFDINYCPFDSRKIYYNPQIVDRDRKNIMRHFMNGPNVGFVFKRGFVNQAPPIFITNKITDYRSWSCSGMQGGDYVAPLYLKPESNNGYSHPNLNIDIVKEIAKRIGLPDIDHARFFSISITEESHDFTPLNIFDYIYGRLHSPNYREKYKEFLKIDFPRIPFPESADEFWHFVKAGQRLRKLHLMDDVAMASLPLIENMANFNVSGNGIVESIKFSPPPTPPRLGGGAGGGNRVYINTTQYFDNVPLVAWESYIGGYQPAQKWLKDRKGKELSFDDVLHYQKIIKILYVTHIEMERIDLMVN